jgi:competence protein ComEC
LAFPRPRLDRETDSESAFPKGPVWGKRARAVCAALFAGAMVATALSFWYAAPARGRLVITVLDVGDGTCVVLQLPEGKTVLYDAGSLGPYDVGAGTIVPFLRHRGVRRVDAVHLSHANLDHFSGVPTLIEAIPTGPVLLNEYFEPHSTTRAPGRKLLDVLEERGHTVKVLDPTERVWEMGGAVFERLWPLGPYDETLQTNETSTVLRVSFEGHSILLTGDIEDRAQRVMLERGDLGADVLLLPHHGGVVSSTPAFIRAVGAATVVRSTNQSTAETTSGLNEIVKQRPPGTGRTPPPRLHNTADYGAVEITMDAGGITVSPNYPEPPAP